MGGLVSNAQTIHKRLFEKDRDKIKALLPVGLGVDRFLQIAWGLVRANPKLLECTADSIVAGIGSGAQLGLSFDKVLGQAFLVPYWNSRLRVLEAQFQAGYRGLIQLSYRSDLVASIYSEIVHKDDVFEETRGTSPSLKHIPNRKVTRVNEEDWIAAYAVAHLKGTTVPLFRVLDASEIYDRRNKSKTWAKEETRSTSLWTTSAVDMWLKSPIRAIAKILPQSTDERDAVRAAIEDEYRDAGVDVPSAPELPAGAIEVETEALPEEARPRPKLPVRWEQDGKVAVLEMAPQPFQEQRGFRDIAKEDKKRKVWIVNAADMPALFEIAETVGYDIYEVSAAPSTRNGAAAGKDAEAPAAPKESELGF